MMQTLSTFAALSMTGTILLSLLPEGGLKRTAGMAVGLLTLMCWAEGVTGLLQIDLPTPASAGWLTTTGIRMEEASAVAAAALAARWEGLP